MLNWNLIICDNVGVCFVGLDEFALAEKFFLTFLNLHNLVLRGSLEHWEEGMLLACISWKKIVVLCFWNDYACIQVRDIKNANWFQKQCFTKHNQQHVWQCEEQLNGILLFLFQVPLKIVCWHHPLQHCCVFSWVQDLKVKLCLKLSSLI